MTTEIFLWMSKTTFSPLFKIANLKYHDYKGYLQSKTTSGQQGWVGTLVVLHCWFFHKTSVMGEVWASRTVAVSYTHLTLPTSDLV